MKTSALLLLALAGALAMRGDEIRQPRPLALTHATVIDSTGAPARVDMTVVIESERITRLGKS